MIEGHDWPFRRQAAGKRGADLFARMVEESTVLVRQLARLRSEEVRYFRWLANHKVTVAEMMWHCGERIRHQVVGRHVLAIQDTSEINYQAHAGRTKGLGTVGNGTDAGLFLHPVLAVDADSGKGLGLVDCQIWLRTTAKAANYQSLPIEEKESLRWLTGAESAHRILRQAARVTMIADRESDIYEEWARLPDHRFDLLTRACRDRRLDVGGTLFAHTDSLPVAACYRLELTARPGKRPARSARMELRFGAVTIRKPKNCSDPSAPQEISLRIVDVREIPAGQSGELIHWRLLTTHSVDSVEDALQIVDWYRQRWHIEQLFRTLKQQGLDIEASQLESGDALMRLAALAVQAATRCMLLVLGRDDETDQSAATVFDSGEIPVLAALQSKLEGKTVKQKNPHPKASLAWGAWIIARLGGWKGYRSESPPGPITMHIGLTKFTAIHQGFRLAQQVGQLS